MRSYEDDYNEKILRIKGEFINFLKKGLEKRSDKERADQKEIHKLVYEFIFDQVADKGIEVIKGKNKNKKKILFFKFFVNTVDWCLSYSEIVLNVLSDLKRYGDLEMYEVKEKIIDA